MKDHQLALLDRNQYPDRGVGIKLTSGMSRDQAAAAAAAAAVSAEQDKALKQADSLQVNKPHTCMWPVCFFSACGAFNEQLSLSRPFLYSDAPIHC